jgi:general secretion pathway protein K
VPIDRSFVDGLFAGAPAATSPSLFATQERKPEASGPTFDAVIEDEARKVNAQFFGFTQGTDVTLRQRVQSLYQLVCAARFDPLFDREDANGVRSTREDLLVRLRDWVDEGDVTSALAAGPGSTSAQCGLVVGQPPFVDAFGDENQLYDRGDVRYKTKNAQLDSLDELHLVYGIGDTFMGAFGDSLTVYLKSGDKQNVNDLDKDRLVSRAFMLANPKNQPALFDPELGNKLLKAMRELTFGGLLSMSPKQFGVLVATTGITIDQSLLADNGPFTDRSKVFRIRATGKAGAVRSTIDTVVRFEDTKVPGEQIAAPGRIIHWRED